MVGAKVMIMNSDEQDTTRQRSHFGGKILRALGVLMLLVGLYNTPVSLQAGEPSPGPVVKEIRIVGLQSLGINTIKSKMGTRVGKPLDDNTLGDDFQRLDKLPEIADVQIEKKTVEGGVKLTILVREKPFVRRIVFRGNKKVKSKKLQDFLKTTIGGRYDKGVVNGDIRAIQDYYREQFYYFGEVKAEAEPYEDGVRLVFHVQEGGKLTIKKIVLRGNYHIKTKAIKKILATKEDSLFGRGKFDREEFEKDLERIRRFYDSKGYLDVKVTERPFKIVSSGSKRKAVVYIDIEEGEQYRVGQVSFKGNDLVSAEDLLRVIKTMPGKVYSRATAQADARKIRDVYGKYPSSRYFTRVIDDRQLTQEGPIMDVTFRIHEGEPVILEGFQVNGLTRTQERVVRRELEVLPGQKIDSGRVNASTRNLKNLGLFELVQIDIREGSAADRAMGVVEVKEAQTGRLQMGVGLSTTESFLGNIQLSQRNFDIANWPDSWKDLLKGKAFTGAGQKFSANIAAGRLSQNYSVSFNNPWIYGKPVSFGVNLGFRSFEFRRYTEDRLQMALSLGKRLLGKKNLTGRITYKIENVTLSEFDNDPSPELVKEEGSAIISRAILNITWDSRNNHFDPTEGLLLSGTQEVAGTVLGGDRDFWRSFLEGDLFHPVWRDKSNRPWVLRLQGKVAAAEEFGSDNFVPLFERLYAGGVGSMRGFRFRTISPRDANGDEIGGRLRITGGAEFFVPVYERLIRASAFYDIGGVWKSFDNFDGDLWRSSAGFGLHVQTPLSPVPIRLYWSSVLDKVTGDDEQTFQFTLGLLF